MLSICFFSIDLGSQPVEEMLGLKLLCAGKTGAVEANQGVSTGYYPADKTGGVQLTGSTLLYPVI